MTAGPDTRSETARKAWQCALLVTLAVLAGILAGAYAFHAAGAS
jgi:hypothetical protein